MYEPFSQENPGNGGTGLGLAIAKQMVTLMGGTMGCVSELGKGTTFTINMTNRIADIQEELSEHSGHTTGQKVLEKDLTGKHILLCEDHPLNAQIARNLLERRGIRVSEARDGEEGLHLFENSALGEIDLILMDIRMPKMNGLESARAIRALNREDAGKIPIIAMTANAFKEDVEESKAAGMNEHLSKPIDPKILYVTLEKYLLSGCKNS